MAKRKKLNYKKSRRDFTKKSGYNPKNDKATAYIMRGGIRL